LCIAAGKGYRKRSTVLSWRGRKGMFCQRRYLNNIVKGFGIVGGVAQREYEFVK